MRLTQLPLNPLAKPVVIADHPARSETAGTAHQGDEQEGGDGEHHFQSLPDCHDAPRGRKAWNTFQAGEGLGRKDFSEKTLASSGTLGRKYKPPRHRGIVLDDGRAGGTNYWHQTKDALLALWPGHRRKQCPTIKPKKLRLLAHATSDRLILKVSEYGRPCRRFFGRDKVV